MTSSLAETELSYIRTCDNHIKALDMLKTHDFLQLLSKIKPVRHQHAHYTTQCYKQQPIAVAGASMPTNLESKLGPNPPSLPNLPLLPPYRDIAQPLNGLWCILS